MSFLCSLWYIYIDLFSMCLHERARNRGLICWQWRGPGTGSRSHGLQLTLEMKRLQGADELEKLTASGHVEHVSSTETLAAAQSRQEVLETPKN